MPAAIEETNKSVAPAPRDPVLEWMDAHMQPWGVVGQLPQSAPVMQVTGSRHAIMEYPSERMPQRIIFYDTDIIFEQTRNNNGVNNSTNVSDVLDDDDDEMHTAVGSERVATPVTAPVPPLPLETMD